MGQPTLKTKTLLGIVQKALSDSNYAIDQYPEFRELFEGQAPANVHAQVPGQWHVNAAGQRTRLKTIYEVVTQDPNFGENAKGLVRAARGTPRRKSLEQGERPKGARRTKPMGMGAIAVLGGLLTTASQLPAPDSGRADRRAALLTAARKGGRDGRSGRG